MRIVNTFRYKNKYFKAGELTIGDYCIYLEDPAYFLDKVLTEFNEKKPELEKEYIQAFLNILFDKQDDGFNSLFKKPSKKEEPNDFHISIGFFMKFLNQQYGEIMQMPMKLFIKLQEDIEIITGTKEYDKNRNNPRLDSKALRETFGNSKEIK